MTTAGHSPPVPSWKPAGPAMPVVPPPKPPVVEVKASLANREPVALGASLQGLLTATLAVVVGFEWWTPTAAQVGLLLALYTAVTGFVTAWVRGRAWAPASVAKLVEGKG